MKRVLLVLLGIAATAGVAAANANGGPGLAAPAASLAYTAERAAEAVRRVADRVEDQAIVARLAVAATELDSAVAMANDARAAAEEGREDASALVAAAVRQSAGAVRRADAAVRDADALVRQTDARIRQAEANLAHEMYLVAAAARSTIDLAELIPGQRGAPPTDAMGRMAASLARLEEGQRELLDQQGDLLERLYALERWTVEHEAWHEDNPAQVIMYGGDDEEWRLLNEQRMREFERRLQEEREQRRLAEQRLLEEEERRRLAEQLSPEDQWLAEQRLREDERLRELERQLREEQEQRRLAEQRWLEEQRAAAIVMPGANPLPPPPAGEIEVIPNRRPYPYSARVYRVQVGAFQGPARAANAVALVERVTNGLPAVQEFDPDIGLTRVFVEVSAGYVWPTIERLAHWGGFRQFLWYPR